MSTLLALQAIQQLGRRRLTPVLVLPKLRLRQQLGLRTFQTVNQPVRPQRNQPRLVQQLALVTQPLGKLQKAPLRRLAGALAAYQLVGPQLVRQRLGQQAGTIQLQRLRRQIKQRLGLVHEILRSQLRKRLRRISANRQRSAPALRQLTQPVKRHLLSYNQLRKNHVKPSAHYKPNYSNNDLTYNNGLRF